MLKIDEFWKDFHCVQFSVGAVDFVLPALVTSKHL